MPDHVATILGEKRSGSRKTTCLHLTAESVIKFLTSRHVVISQSAGRDQVDKLKSGTRLENPPQRHSKTP